MSDEENELLYEFLSESEEHLQILNDKMLDVEDSIKNNTEMSADDLNSMFRSAHTIKGTASFIGLTQVVSLTHKAETLLQRLRDNEIKLTPEIVDALFAAFDTLTELLTKLKESSSEEGVAIEAIVETIEKILSAESSPVAGQDATATQKEAGSESSEEEPKKEKAEETKEEPVVEQAKEKAEEEVSALPPAEKTPVNKKYLEQFLIELDQNLEDVEGCLLKAEQEPKNLQIVNDIFRFMHTIKGSSGIVNAVEIADVAHKMENILSLYRENSKTLNSDLVSLLFKGTDIIKGLSDSLKQKQCIDTDISGIISELENHFALLKEKGLPETAQEKSTPQDNLLDIDQLLDINKLNPQQKEILASGIEDGQDVFTVKIDIDESVDMKEMKAAIVEERLAKNGHIISVQPDPDTIKNASGKLVIGIIFSSNINEQNIREILNLDGIVIASIERLDENIIVGTKDIPKEEPVSEKAAKGETMISPINVETKSPSGEKSAPIEISTIKIDSRKLDNLMNLSGELVIIRAQYARLAHLFSNDSFVQKEILQTAAMITSSVEAVTKEINNGLETADVADKNVGNVQKLTSELNGIIDELKSKISQSELIENVHALNETTSTLEKVSSDIQAGVMQTRMVPIEGVFTRFKRIVRDISKDINKEVNLQISGAETELDKKIVDSLGDPLTHMIRNAVDHGIDDAEERLKLGKPKTGTVFLKASHKGNSICIEVADDGRGIDSEKLAQSAIKKGLLTQEQIDRMSEKDKLNIMFLPGFSTAEKVTGLSGRGVGMDVVRNMITSLNGVVDIDTVLNKGTTFTLKIPLTLAIIQSLLVSVGGEIYAFPLESVTEIIKVSADEIYSVDGNATVKLRNHALSLIELEKVIKIKNAKEHESEQSRKVVIINDGDTRLGVVVDALVGKDEIVIKPFTEHFANVKGITGASILADGNVALILDPTMIIKESR